MGVDRRERFRLGRQVRLADLHQNPYPLLKELQEAEPISWVSDVNGWFVTRRADMLAILLDSATFSVASAGSFLENTLGRTMLSTDGVEQRRLRQPFQAAFAPKAVQTHMADRIAVAAHAIIDQFSAQGQADLKTAFADHLALWTVMEMLGLPIEDFTQVRQWFTAISEALGNFAHDLQVRERGRAAAAAFGAYALPHLQRLRQEPDGSLLAALASSDQMTEEEILSATRLIIFGGLETTSAMLANTMWALLRHPAQYEAVLASPDLLSQAIEESLRWEAPVQSCTRYVTRPITIHGVELSPGDLVQGMVGAANRDPEYFPQPDVFNLWRANAKDHLSFAIGKHFCLGAALARLEGQVGLALLFERLPELQLDPARPSAPAGHEFRSPATLQVLWKA
jgi:cytochrome P450